jgi:hypothetical protein
MKKFKFFWWFFGIGLAAWMIDAIAHDWVPIPIGFWDVWTVKGSMFEGLATVWFIFAWAIIINMLFYVKCIIRKDYRDAEPHKIFFGGIILSFFVGIFEEISYRWFRFFLAMFGLALLNACTWNIIKDLYVMFFMPLANWLTFGLLSPQMTNTNAWVLGAAIIMANGRFMEDHKYLGWLGYLNSWFIGMIFFFLMLNYGLLTAIVAHILYDACIFTTAAIGSAFLAPRFTIRASMSIRNNW